MAQRIERSIRIEALPATVWEALTNPVLMKQWMGEPGMEIEILTDWKVGHPIIIRGFHHVPFENRGEVLCYERDRLLRYTHLSSLSQLPDTPEHYTVMEFRLAPVEGATLLMLNIHTFPTESIFKHLELYWGATMEIMKKVIEDT